MMSLPFAKNNRLSTAVCSLALFILVVSSPSLVAQVSTYDTQYNVLKAEIANKTHPAFKNVEVPEKWQGESAVILAQETNIEYSKLALGKMRVMEKRHTRIALLDQAAVEEYTSYELPEEKSRYPGVKLTAYYGFELIKASGERIPIDVDENSVEVEESVGRRKRTKRKVSIPNLERGDILDYFLVTEIAVGVSGYFPFSPEHYPLPNVYPVVYQKFSLRTNQKFHINARSINGAPELKRRVDGDDYVFELEDSDREKYVDARWLYPRRSLPALKYQVIFKSAGVNIPLAFLGSPGSPKKNITKDEIRTMIRVYGGGNVPDYGLRLKKKFSKLYSKVRNGDDIMEIAYNAYRAHAFTQYAAVDKVEGERPESVPYVYMIFGISSYLKKRQIPHEILVGSPKYLSAHKDLLYPNELFFAIRLKDQPDMLIAEFTRDAFLGELDPVMAGAKVYVFDSGPNEIGFNTEELPSPDADANKINMSQVITLDPEALKATIDGRMQITGFPKAPAQYAIIDHLDIEAEERALYRGFETYSGASYSTRTINQQKIQVYQNDRPAIRRDSLKSYLNQLYEQPVDTVTAMDVVATGRTKTSPVFEMSGQWQSGEVMSKAGPNYIVDLSKLFIQQPELDPEEVERDYDAYFRFKRSYTEVLTIKTPEGYSLQTENEKDYSFVNYAGSVNVKTERTGDNDLKITATLSYDEDYIKVEEWSDFVALLKAVNEARQMKLLLRKE